MESPGYKGRYKDRDVLFINAGNNEVICITYDVLSGWCVLTISDEEQQEWTPFAELTPEIRTTLENNLYNRNITEDIRSAFYNSVPK